MPCVAEAV